jgi:predicted O-linked N-acetylglucosamine transferase (SPINDLY family)
VNPHPDYSFVPRWKPPFITRLAGEDRCHLNGLGMRDGRPAFVTAMSQTDEAGGWRADKNLTGCVLDVSSGEAVTTGLAMPHSPRWHGGRLLVLNSGLGTIESVDLESGERAQIEAVPGFTRGLACRGNLAFVGLSRIRETAVFGGVPIAARHGELKCGVGVVDLERGTTVATLQFESGIEEIFDVQLLPDARSVALAGGDRGEEIWVVPSDTMGPIRPGLSDEAVSTMVSQALALQRAGRPADAAAILNRVAAARPRSAEIANHLGNALQDAGNQDAALEAYRHAAAADPSFGPALQNLGYVLISQGLTDEGAEYIRQAQRVDAREVNRLLVATAAPVIYASVTDLAARRKVIEGEVQKLVDAGLQIDTEDTLVPTGFFLAYQGENDRALHEGFGRIFRGPDLAETARQRRASGASDGDGRLRIGFLSAYFRDHTIGRLNLGRIQHLSRERFRVVVLSASASRDPVADAFEKAADRFVRLPREVAAARALIAEQGLDLLLFTDVGMDALTYTLAFSRMAPVQCATWGHPVTTGSPMIDFFVSSELLEVPGAEDHYTEKLGRLPSLGTYYPRLEPPEVDGARAKLGLAGEENVYACPQTLFKFHPAFDLLLADILRRDPAGVLVLIEGRVAAWTRLLQERFARTMPDVIDRIRWLRPLPRPAFLELLAAADVVLDPVRFGGGNTSYEALAMGTPVVTLPGELLRNRITRALYAKAGYTEPVVDSEDEYVDQAVRLGTDSDYRRAVVERIREDCQVLYEDDAEVRDLEVFLGDVAER